VHRGAHPATTPGSRGFVPSLALPLALRFEIASARNLRRTMCPLTRSRPDGTTSELPRF